MVKIILNPASDFAQFAATGSNNEFDYSHHHGGDVGHDHDGDGNVVHGGDGDGDVGHGGDARVLIEGWAEHED